MSDENVPELDRGCDVTAVKIVSALKAASVDTLQDHGIKLYLN